MLSFGVITVCILLIVNIFHCCFWFCVVLLSSLMINFCVVWLFECWILIAWCLVVFMVIEFCVLVIVDAYLVFICLCVLFV